MALAALALYVAEASVPGLVHAPAWWPSPGTLSITLDLPGAGSAGSADDTASAPRESARPRSFRLPSLPNGTEVESTALIGGRGRLTIVNATERDAVVEAGDEETGARRLVYLRARHEATIDRIPPGIYRVTLSFGVDWDPTWQAFRRDRSRVEAVRALLFDERYRHDRIEVNDHAITLRATVVRAGPPW